MSKIQMLIVAVGCFDGWYYFDDLGAGMVGGLTIFLMVMVDPGRTA
jgi:hypothetical protein